MANTVGYKCSEASYKEINWLYKNVDDESSRAARNVVEVVDKASSTMLEKASADDVAALQAYMI